MNNIVKQQVKKVASAAVLVAAFLGTAQAQSGSNNGLAGEQAPTSVKLNVVLNPVRTLLVQGSEINLEYKTVEDYKNGVEHTTTGGHLQVTNIGGGYKIYVKSTSPDLKQAGGSNTLDGNTVTIEGIANSGVQAYTRKVSEVNTGTNGSELFHVGKDIANKAVATAFEVKYKAAGGNAYTKSIQDNKAETYTVDIVYTILSE